MFNMQKEKKNEVIFRVNESAQLHDQATFS